MLTLTNTHKTVLLPFLQLMMTETVDMNTLEDISYKCNINNHSSLLVRLVIAENDFERATNTMKKWQRATWTLVALVALIIVSFILILSFYC